MAWVTVTSQPDAVSRSKDARARRMLIRRSWARSEPDTVTRYGADRDWQRMARMSMASRSAPRSFGRLITRLIAAALMAPREPGERETRRVKTRRHPPGKAWRFSGMRFRRVSCCFIACFSVHCKPRINPAFPHESRPIFRTGNRKVGKTIPPEPCTNAALRPFFQKMQIIVA